MVLFAKVRRGARSSWTLHIAIIKAASMQEGGVGGQEDEKVLGAGHVGEKPAVEAAMKCAARSGTRRSLGAKVKEI